MKILLLSFILSAMLFADQNHKVEPLDNNQTAISISQKSVDDILKEYNKTLVLISNTEQSIHEYHETLKTSITSLKETYVEVVPDLSKNANRIIVAVEDANTTIKSSMDVIEKNINDYYVIEIVAFISLLIAINNILEIVIKLKRFRFVRNWIKKFTKTND
jgi:hypothetical protein